MPSRHGAGPKGATSGREYSHNHPVLSRGWHGIHLFVFPGYLEVATTVTLSSSCGTLFLELDLKLCSYTSSRGVPKPTAMDFYPRMQNQEGG